MLFSSQTYATIHNVQMNKSLVESILNRPINPVSIEDSLKIILSNKVKVLITGANGSIGKRVCEIFTNNDLDFLATDIEDLDITIHSNVNKVVSLYKPSLILNLAADKHAPDGEFNPFVSNNVNVNGVQNLIMAAEKEYAKIVLTSTCKACNPETVYGATKLVAERMVLNHGGSVARFYNVVETQGNVFDIWNRSTFKDSIDVTECYRYFISIDEGVNLVIKTIAESLNDSVRLTVNPEKIHYMPDIANRIYPDKVKKVIPIRRGDRVQEPLLAFQEKIVKEIGSIRYVYNPHDVVKQT
jgi:FlaA1/EpsC-like NDP-sugar epimerase